MILLYYSFEKVRQKNNSIFGDKTIEINFYTCTNNMYQFTNICIFKSSMMILSSIFIKKHEL